MTNDEKLVAELEVEKSDAEALIENIADESAKKILQTEVARKRHFREKSVRLEAELNELKNKKQETPLVPMSPKQDSNPTPASDAGLTIMEAMRLRSEGYSDKEVLELVQQATSLGVAVDKVLSNDTFKAGLAAKRALNEAERNTPSSSNAIVSDAVIGGKKYSEMNDTERANNFEAIKAEMLGRGGKGRQAQ